jgi:D-alanyl-D-alanine carboxypeptidase
MVTTAREMALLGLAIQDRFPQYYHYFSTRKFYWRGAAIGNHNKLLGRVEGVDGIKTGYTRASGFNLVSNVKRGGRHIVAVVMGGKTGASRDAHMREMIAEEIRHASVGPRTAPRFAEGNVPMPVPSPVTTAALRPPAPKPGSADPIERKAVRIVSVDKDGEILSEGDRPGGPLPINTLSAASVQSPLQPAPTGVAPSGKIVTFAPPPPPSAVATASTQTSTQIVERKAAVASLASDAKTERAAVLSSLAAEPNFSPTPAQAALEKAQKAAPERGEWIVQVGAFPTEAAAEKRLAEAQKSAANVLADSDPYTEKTMGKKQALYRARFAGLDEAEARRACETLKKRDIACFVAKN